MLQHAFVDDVVARLPCSAILSRLLVSISTVSSISVRLSLSSAESASAAFPQLVQPTSIRQPGEVYYEIERVFDLMGDAGRSAGPRRPSFSAWSDWLALETR